MLKEDDLVSFSEFTVTKYRFHRRQFMLLTQSGHLLILAGAAIVFGGVWGTGEWVFRLARIRRAVRRRLRDETYTKRSKPTRVELLSGGVREISKLGTVLIPWSSIINIIINKSAAYVYFTSIAAFIIPRRAFVSESAFDDFIGQIQKRCGNRTELVAS